MIITTTHSIQNHDIVKYLGVINANQVLGVNFFSDAIAGISDVFGGNSGTYRRNLDSLYEQVIALLKQKATSIGANAIIGIQIDFDEISGKGKSMFMITAVGTAVIVSETSNISSRYSNLRMLHELRTFVNEGLLSEEEYNREKEKIDNIVTNQVEIDTINENVRKAQEEELKRVMEERVKARAEKIRNSKPLQNLTIEDIEAADVPPMENDDNTMLGIKELADQGLYAEACKFYMEQTGLDAKEAYEFVLDTCIND